MSLKEALIYVIYFKEGAFLEISFFATALVLLEKENAVFTLWTTAGNF